MHAFGDGFARADKAKHWDNLDMPTLLVKRDSEKALAGWASDEGEVM